MSKPDDSTISLLICDDHRLLTDALAAVVHSEPGMSLIADPVDNAHDAVSLAATHQPDVILMDIELKGPVNGIEATRQITALSPGSKVVVVSGQRRPTVMVEAVEAGASGFLDKGADVAEVLGGIRAVAAGETLIDPRQLTRLLPALAAQRSSDADARERLSRLTPREREVVQLLAEGQRSDVVARRLFISTATARTHIANILAKLDVHSQLEAVTLVARVQATPP